MATAQNVIDSAAVKLGLCPTGTSFATWDSNANTDAFTVLQDLISKLTADNCLHIPTPSTVGTTLDLYEEQVRDLKLLLARDLIVEFRISDFSPLLFEQVKDAERSLSADNNISMAVQMPGLSFSYKYDVTSDI
jgi:hypothetical protein